MKTIEEGLDEAYKKAGQNAYFANGFNAGVEFAQQWHPVEEELPPIDKDVVEIGFNASITVEVRIGNKVQSAYFIYSTHRTHNMKCVSLITGSAIKPTHWRPIELK